MEHGAGAEVLQQYFVLDAVLPGEVHDGGADIDHMGGGVEIVVVGIEQLGKGVVVLDDEFDQ